MKRYGVFDIVGPVMVGPSSSHTAGAARLGRMVRYLCNDEIAQVTFQLHGSFAQTYKGHGTDKALLAGILDIDSADYRLRDSLDIAREKGLRFQFLTADLGDVHPNTVRFLLTMKSGRNMSVTGSSIGGGSDVITDIDGVECYLSGEKPILVTKHTDTPGVISHITALLYQSRLNIGNMRVNRDEESGEASMYLELDGPVDDGLLGQIRAIPGITRALLLDNRLLDPGEAALGREVAHV